MTATVMELDAVRFKNCEQHVLRSGQLRAATFRYSTGVCGLRITSARGEIEVLPYQGQQVWRARFDGRELTMGSMFEEQRPTRNYLDTYGAFIIHCGLLAMGNPGPADTHPLHGELPNAPYVHPQLISGEDDAGLFLTLTGEYEHSTAFAYHYGATAALTMREKDARLQISLSVRNLGSRPMPLMYLAHINFRPVDGAYVLVPATGERYIVPEPPVNPEQVTWYRPEARGDGWAYAMQVHPDGGADFVCQRPSQLGHTVRWVVRDGDQDACGFALPASAETEGLAREMEKGNVQSLAPGAVFVCEVGCGVLQKSEAALMLAMHHHR